MVIKYIVQYVAMVIIVKMVTMETKYIAQYLVIV